MSTAPIDLPRVVHLPRAQDLAAVDARRRLQSIDIVRGLVMVLMTLDHVRDYFSNARFDPLDPHATSAALYLTRWITHLCAPTFVFLAGVSAYLMSGRCTRNELSRFLLTRGIWLVILEVTVVIFGWTFSIAYDYGLFLQVIWAIGVSMICLAALVRLSVPAVFCIAIVMIAGHNLLDGIEPQHFGAWAPLWTLLHVQGPIGPVFVAYPVIPWIGVMALGYSLGSLYQRDSADRQQLLALMGCASLMAFFVLRLANAYGDPTPWMPQASFTQTLFSFFDVEKYPPSLMYLLATLGIAFLMLAAFERLQGSWTRVLQTFGRVPLFFYILHIMLTHLLAGLVALATGFGVGVLAGPWLFLPANWGFGLAGVYLAWVAVLLISYPLCRWFAGVKQRRRDWWLSYL